jgi:hypothetical protein
VRVGERPAARDGLEVLRKEGVALCALRRRRQPARELLRVLPARARLLQVAAAFVPVDAAEACKAPSYSGPQRPRLCSHSRQQHADAVERCLGRGRPPPRSPAPPRRARAAQPGPLLLLPLLSPPERLRCCCCCAGRRAAARRAESPERLRGRAESARRQGRAAARGARGQCEALSVRACAAARPRGKPCR